MGLNDAQRAAINAQGLVSPDDFADFNEDTLNIAFKNTRTANPPVSIPAKSTQRLIVASIAYEYYTTTQRKITPQNMHYTNVLRDFYTEWKAIVDMSKRNDELKMPTLSKNCPPLKWCASMRHYLSTYFGVRKIPLTYVLREQSLRLSLAQLIFPASDHLSIIETAANF